MANKEPSTIAASSAENSAAAAAPDLRPGTKDAGGIVLFWYRIVFRLVQKVFGMVFKPHQTMREFAGEASAPAGAAGRYLMDFTRIAEKASYSSRAVVEKEARDSERLAGAIRGALEK
jgi:hypothetical protein